MSGHREHPSTVLVNPLPEQTLRAARPVARRLMGRRWTVHSHGAEQVPRDGPVILASNHIGWLDGPLLVAYAPRPVHALVKSEMFTGRTGALLSRTGQIPIVRGTVDVTAVRASVRALRDGQGVVVYPEGRRGSGTFERFRGGCAYFALVTGAPVVPVAVLGTRAGGEDVGSRPPTGRRIDVVYGRPIPVAAAPWPRTAEAVSALSASLQAQLAAHLADAVRITGQPLPGHPPVPDPEGTQS